MSTLIDFSNRLLRGPFFVCKLAFIKIDCYTSSIQSYRINNQITAPEVRVVDAEGKNLGVMKSEKALALAKEKGFDLIEIASNARPPVVKIISFDKFRYQREKEEKKQKHGQRTKELKHVRITPRAAGNDLMTKARRADEFLEKGYRVEINLFLRGREKANKEWALLKLREFVAMIKTPYDMTMEPRAAGRGFVTQIAKK